ncbi:MAG: SPASM domain-containing protein [Candidatus Riflebacteria bacterium]|nr:SPASM domain-containing protein [Candidatus Riflebacteria bacterium]
MGRGPTTKYYKVLNQDYVEGTLTCLKQATIKEQINNDFPLILNIEPTNRCNLSCYYCPRKKAEKGFGDMPFEVFRRIIDEASHFKKLIMLNLHKDGEPFLHADFFEMVKYAKQKNVAKTVHLNTNALCWTDSVIENILNCGIDDITLSIDAARQETFRRLKGVDCLERIERQVKRFFEKRKELALKRPFARAKIMEFAGISREEIREFYEKWEPIADMVQVTGVHSWSGEIKNIQITDERAGKRFPCGLLWYSLAINWNGEVTVCSVDWNTELKVGNIRNQSLTEIWNSKEIKNIRKAHLKAEFTDYQVCEQCIVWVSIGDLTSFLKERKEFFE